MGKTIRWNSGSDSFRIVIGHNMLYGHGKSLILVGLACLIKSMIEVVKKALVKP